MELKKTQIFLVQGQRIAQVDGAEQRSAQIEQVVVLALDQASALDLVTRQNPAMRPLGATSLHDYEDTAARMRRVVSGQSLEWPLVVDSAMRA